MKKIAKELAKKGLKVFQLHSISQGKCTCSNHSCTNEGKHPRGKGWQEQATSDLGIIDQWQGEIFNTGVMTGKEGGVIVIDVDVSNGKPGVDSVKRLAKDYKLPLNKTPMVRTGSGGYHFYFAHPGVQIQNAVGRADTSNPLKDYPGVDIRGEGGLVVAPGSVHKSGNKYEWKQELGNGYELCNLTQDFIELVKTKPKKQSESYAQSSENQGDFLDLKMFFDSSKPITEGGRNDALFRLASKMRGAGVPLVYAQVLLAIACSHCEPPYPEEEGLEMLNRVYQHYAPEKPEWGMELINNTQNEEWHFLKSIPPLGQDTWVIENQSIYFQTHKKNENTGELTIATKTLVLPHLIYVDKVFNHSEQNTKHISLVSVDGKNKKNIMVRYDEIYDHSKIVGSLSQYGVEIDSERRAILSKYIQYILKEYKEQIPQYTLTHNVGWHTLENGEEGFLFGEKLLTKNGQKQNIVYDNTQPESIAFTGALVEKGDLSVWLNLARECGEYPRAALMLGCAFASPLLRKLGAFKNLVVQMTAPSSSGKSTITQLAASVWANPIDTASYVKSWETTYPGFERWAAATTGLPIFYEESQKCDKETFKKIIMDYANGVGKTKATGLGRFISPPKVFEGILISNGEGDVVKELENDGAVARILQFDGVGIFGQPDDPDIYDKSVLIQNIVQNNFGLAGPAMLKNYLNNKETVLPMLKNKIEEYKEKFTDKDNRLARRLGDITAVVGAVMYYISDLFELNWDVEAIMKECKKYVSKGAENSASDNGYQDFVGWIVSNSSRIENSPHYSPEKNNQIIGKCLQSKDGSEYVAILRPEAQKWAQSYRGEKGAVLDTYLNSWRQAGKIICEPSRTTKKVRIRDANLYCVCVPLKIANTTYDSDDGLELNEETPDCQSERLEQQQPKVTQSELAEMVELKKEEEVVVEKEPELAVSDWAEGVDF